MTTMTKNNKEPEAEKKENSLSEKMIKTRTITLFDAIDSKIAKEFIQSLFPEEDIYLCLLDTKARTVVGRVGESTKPAQYLLESIGFHYLEEVDPFDGGPHYGAKVQDLLPIKYGKNLKVTEWNDSNFKKVGLVGVNGHSYRCVQTPYEERGDEVALPIVTKKLLEIENDEMVYVTPTKF